MYWVLSTYVEDWKKVGTKWDSLTTGKYTLPSSISLTSPSHPCRQHQRWLDPNWINHLINQQEMEWILTKFFQSWYPILVGVVRCDRSVHPFDIISSNSVYWVRGWLHGGHNGLETFVRQRRLVIVSSLDPVKLQTKHRWKHYNIMYIINNGS